MQSNFGARVCDLWYHVTVVLFLEAVFALSAV